MYDMLIVLSFVFWTGERHLILGTAKKGILAFKYGLKNLMFWKGGSVFVFTDDKSLRIYSIFMWFELPRPPEMLQWNVSRGSKTKWLQAAGAEGLQCIQTLGPASRTSLPAWGSGHRSAARP